MPVHQVESMIACITGGVLPKFRIQQLEMLDKIGINDMEEFFIFAPTVASCAYPAGNFVHVS